HAVIDRALEALEEVDVPDRTEEPAPVPKAFTTEPDFIRRVTARLLAGEGDQLPVSALPVDGTFPTGTTRYEKRGLASEIPIWDADLCIDCGRCALSCPHAAIRMKAYDPSDLVDPPPGFAWKEATGRDLAGKYLTIQVAPEDCTGCGVCVDVCPAVSKEVAAHKAIDMTPIDDFIERERENFDYFLSLRPARRQEVNLLSVKGTQLIDPLFEFSGACAGCGETPYLKLMTQMFGDRVVGGNPTRSCKE
ncbi:MAG: 4Fe-4S double cluster binding domain-containing protein, partial [Acidimicrobiia bacterium]|nr:4Fe-4S double cluster binding domain-containing protein [Acidimicrobiia bacterium]